MVSGLLIGLFLVTGAHSVVAAFETTPQYEQAARQIEHGQRIEFMATPANAEHLISRGEHVKGVRRVIEVPLLTTAAACQPVGCLQAVVATCAQLHLLAPGLTGCRDDQPMWLDRANVAPLPRNATLTWFAKHDDQPLRSVGPLATVRAPKFSLHGDVWTQLQPIDAQVLLPPSAIAPGALPARSQIALLALGVPGRGLRERLQQQAYKQLIPDYWDFEPYDYVARLRAMVWAIAAVILSVGLLSFAVAALDRSVARRREVVSLQLVGVPSFLLRRVQWIEAGLPIVAGTLLAIGLGLFGGATYLSIGAAFTKVPVSQALALAGIAGVGALVIAGLTVLGASPRIRPDLIRAE